QRSKAENWNWRRILAFEDPPFYDDDSAIPIAQLLSLTLARPSVNKKMAKKSPFRYGLWWPQGRGTRTRCSRLAIRCAILTFASIRGTLSC
ncbi:MAG: hypothetical protein AB7K78_23235, partial [Xanthobacteraceae bacterium]